MKKEGILSGFGVSSGVGAAFLAKTACPACYPALAGLFSSLGLGFLFQGVYLFFFSAFFFGLALFGLGYRAKTRRGYRPLTFGVAATVLALAGQHYESTEAFYTGVGGLVLASIWNLIPVNRVNKDPSCRNCDPAGSENNEQTITGGLIK